MALEIHISELLRNILLAFHHKGLMCAVFTATTLRVLLDIITSYNTMVLNTILQSLYSSGRKENVQRDMSSNTFDLYVVYWNLASLISMINY